MKVKENLHRKAVKDKVKVVEKVAILIPKAVMVKVIPIHKVKVAVKVMVAILNPILKVLLKVKVKMAKAEKVKVKEKEREMENPNPIPMAKVKERVKAKVKAKVNPMVKGVMLTKKAKIVPNLFPINSNKR